MRERELLYNAICCPDGTVIESRYSHNFVEHIQEDGRRYFVDGGLDYQRMGYSDKEYENLCVYSDDPHSKIRKVFSWGSFGKFGNEPIQYIKLKDLEDGHLDALVPYTHKYHPRKIHQVFVNELEFRKGEKNGS